MSRRIAIALCTLLMLFSLAGTLRASDKSKLHWYPFEQGLAEAKKTNKKLLVDVYTDWCGWCKKMDADTYTDTGVESYLLEKYVVVKLNAESSTRQTYNGKQYTERELASEFGVSGYPTTLFFKSDGSPITGAPGYYGAADFKTVLSYIAEDHYQKTKFEDYAKTKK
jgi:thioredoxin-related protein